MTRFKIVLSTVSGLALLNIGLCSASGAIRMVPAEYPTIQAAIDAAAPGDQVALADGVYSGPGNIDLDLLSKSITLRSASGDPNACTIDCQDAGRALYVHNSAGPVAVAGIGVANGHVADANGGGILCVGSTLRIQNCIFFSAAAEDGAGGAICAHNCDLTVDRCQFEGCACWLEDGMGDSAGGAICINGGSARVENCVFDGCSANVA